MPQDFQDQDPGTGIVASAVIDDVREKLRDLDDGNYRWSDAILLGFVDGAQRDIFQKRADLFYTADLSGLNQPVALVAVTDVLHLGAAWLQALACYAAGRALAEDGNDAGDAAMAMVYQGRYLAELGIGIK